MKAILVDDEQLALDYLQRLLEKMGGIQVQGAYTNSVTAKKHILQQEVDVVFLDIHLPEINGIELAEKIIEAKPEATIVFTTAYDNYAVQAFELNAIDYLMKPIQLNRLETTMERIKQLNGLKRPIEASKHQFLRVHVFGNLSFQLVDGEKEIVTWRTKKGMETFLYLILHREQLVSKATLIELLWPDANPDKVYTHLYTTIYHVRKTLSKYNNHFKLKNKAEGYILRTKDVLLDVEQWKDKIETLPSLSDKTIQMYEDAMAIYTGGYLQDYDYLWAEGERYKYEQQWVEIALQIAAFYVRQGKLIEAKQWYTRICADAPLVEEAYFALMKIFAAEKDHVSVHRQYQILENVLYEELDVAPSDEVQKWYLHSCTSTNEGILHNTSKR
ncbi:response regulator [Pontibacillus litoralis]|uniref:Response regulatory domain-containing protein n=1 Tax=Pontibacillus litoralis JSM 072002 TaxID=1385512 RepID=A0A0A5G292_9BACI|nr:response regulator [Pontibacillus litoralis]KGX85263.1 hypothetical protein N784_09490 [Pontibacillus litoralis JSM 072002]